MENNKKTFGAYILRRRKELGMTQKEFAQKLYVTESAVSKWERGMSYPDITLLLNICDVLEISEHELLTGSEDTQKRRTEDLAERYLKITRNYRVGQYLLYGGIFLVCAVFNLAFSHCLDWAFIVLAAELIVASLTLSPAVAALHPKFCHYKRVISLGCFMASIEILLLVCALYTGGDWFFVAGISTLFGMTLVLLPFVLPGLSLPPGWEKRKTSLYLLTELTLLLLLLLTCCLYTGGSWFVTAAFGVTFGVGFFILPILLIQLPLPEKLQYHKVLLYFTIQTVLLILLLFVCGPERFLGISLPIAMICLALPWGLMLAIRYLPVTGWFKGAICAVWSAVWVWLSPYLVDRVMTFYYGEESMQPWELLLAIDYSQWEGNQAAINVIGLIIFSLLGLGILLAVVGAVRRRP